MSTGATVVSEVWGEFKKLHPIVKGIIVLGTLAGVGFLGYKGYKMIIKNIDKADENDVLNDVKREQQQLINKGMRLTYPPSVYESSAGFIFNKLDGCETPMSEADVYVEVLRVVKNQLDWTELVKAFGVRTVDDCGLGTGETEYSLATLIKEQLDTRKPSTTSTFSALLISALKQRGVNI